MKKRWFFVSVGLPLLALVGCEDKADLLQNPPAYIVEQIEPYLPMAIDFAKENERIALSEGEPLLPQYLQIANRVGVKHPEKIRIHYVDALPMPSNESLLLQMQRLGLDSPFLAGMTYGYGVWINKKSRGDKLLLAHEFIHVRQAEELGLEELTKQYFLQIKLFGYREAPIEIEAYDNAAKYLE
ncbi:hypothetical protein BIY21_20795 [Vibrio ponticus]|uniref:DUF4157 domain-containing protein n=1 Tax=Vibrio ponticus TaxID=265668 RepID=A0ABX3FMM5_9VIBR|nr:hypothetical protein [Vibrio ponticus]OLQ95471.1 hypothetical protein BIY21_20795 [Vibrio ponticus]